MRRVLLVICLSGCKSCSDSAAPDVDSLPIVLPPFDTAPPPPPIVDACKTIFLIDAGGNVYAFTPDDKKVARLSHASCDLTAGAVDPRSIAVENNGTIWAGTYDGRLVKIRPEDGKCAQTAFVSGTNGFLALNLTFLGDTLWASDDHGWGGDVTPSKGLATIDRTTFAMTLIGNPYPQGNRMLLAGAPDGKLYAEPPVSIDVIDVSKKKPTAKSLTGFEDFAKGDGVPMAFYREGIYLFHTTVIPADVMRLDLATKKYELVLPATFEGIFVSAGAAPCAGSK